MPTFYTLQTYTSTFQRTVSSRLPWLLMMAQPQVWIFSTELTYTSSTTPDPTSAMKVLFRSLPAASTSASSTASASADADILNKENLHKDTLTLPSRLERRLLGTLERGSQKVLPVGLFMGWKVALLEKFVAEDLLR